MNTHTGILVGMALTLLAACGGKGEDKQAGGTTPAAPEATSPSTAAPAQSAPSAQPVAAPAVALAPGASIDQAVPLPFGATAAGEIKTTEQKSFYKIEYKGDKRDFVVIKLTNRSQTLHPVFKLYNDSKSQIAERYDGTPGANVEGTFALQPGATIYVEVCPYNSTGAYELSSVATLAFDAQEPNDDILSAKPAQVGTPIEANVMDERDEDFYRFSGATGKSVHVLFENLSTTLKPEVKAYSATKSGKGEKYDGTAGANLDYDLEVEPGKDFYLQVTPYNSSGKYRLSVTNP